jgi:hypothetical protein
MIWRSFYDEKAAKNADPDHNRVYPYRGSDAAVSSGGGTLVDPGSGLFGTVPGGRI